RRLVLRLPGAEPRLLGRAGEGEADRRRPEAAAPGLGREPGPERLLEPAEPDVERVGPEAAQQLLAHPAARLEPGAGDQGAVAGGRLVDPGAEAAGPGHLLDLRHHGVGPLAGRRRRRAGPAE